VLPLGDSGAAASCGFRARRTFGPARVKCCDLTNAGPSCVLPPRVRGSTGSGWR